MRRGLPEETEQLNPLGIAIAGFKIQADNACNARSLVFGTRKLPVIGSYYYEKCNASSKITAESKGQCVLCPTSKIEILSLLVQQDRRRKLRAGRGLANMDLGRIKATAPTPPPAAGSLVLGNTPAEWRMPRAESRLRAPRTQ